MEKPWSKIALLAAVTAVAATVMAAASGFGHRAGLWTFGQGFAVLKIAVFTGMAALVLSIAGAILARPASGRKGLAAALIGVLLAGTVTAFPLLEMRKAKTVPRIHDISTDTVAPPEFVAVLPLRGDNANSTRYEGEPVASLQKEFYPDIQPFSSTDSAEQLFSKALDAAKKLGWEIVASDSNAGRIEATDTTFWFGFKDDVVIRISQQSDGTRLDIRSVSRVGKSDVGANAARIRQFFRTLTSL